MWCVDIKWWLHCYDCYTAHGTSPINSPLPCASCQLRGQHHCLYEVSEIDGHCCGVAAVLQNKQHYRSTVLYTFNCNPCVVRAVGLLCCGLKRCGRLLATPPPVWVWVSNVGRAFAPINSMRHSLLSRIPCVFPAFELLKTKQQLFQI